MKMQQINHAYNCLFTLWVSIVCSLVICFFYEFLHYQESASGQFVADKHEYFNNIITHQEPIERSEVLNAPVKKELPSAAQLTAGMNAYFKKRTYALSVLKQEYKAPHIDEQMKYERYIQRIYQCVLNYLKAHPYGHVVTGMAHATVFYLAIERDGRLKTAQIVQSSGDSRIDFFLMRIVQEASSSFAPVPYYLPQDPLIVYCSVFV